MVGDRWFNATDGVEVVWTDDGTSTQWVEISASGFTGQTGYTGSASVVTYDGAGNSFSTGYKQLPQKTASTDYTLIKYDDGKHIYYTGTTATVTIPVDAATTGGAFDVGTVVTIVNNGSGAVTIVTAGTLVYAGTNNIGNRVLSAKGIASVLKVAADTWFITGVGLA
jgi:hypothetical protein